MAVMKTMEFVITKVSMNKYPNVYKNIRSGSRIKRKQYYSLNGGILGVYGTKERAKEEARKRAQKGVKNKRPIKIHYEE